LVVGGLTLPRKNHETLATELAALKTSAATRLVTAWNPEPVEISHRTRFDDAKLVFAAAWQILQTNGWTDDQLARLQQEWETADFLSSLPEIQAFKRAADLAVC
jgi:hypothetical protein